MLIDFEKKFTAYLDEHVHVNGLNSDAIEEKAPDLYLDWLERPADWLGGQSPNGYFAVMDALTLVKTLGRYLLSDITLPGSLLNRIADTRDETLPLLIALLKNYDGEKEERIKTTIVRLIEEMGLGHPYEHYISVIAQSETQSDFSEACADALRNAGGAYLEPVMAAYEAAQSRYAMDCFLDILTDLPYDERTYQHVLERFLLSNTQKAFYAHCLGKLGDSKALPFLEEVLRQENIRYYDYVAVKSALEDLGGEAEVERDFTGDADYELLINMREKR